MKLLIATTNKGKINEITSYLHTLPFELISLSDLVDPIAPFEETETTLERNAIAKARYYAEKTGLFTLADHAGLFIDALDGWPGVKSASIAETNNGQQQKVLDGMRDIPQGKRQATFRASVALYHPMTQEVYVSAGETIGEIMTDLSGSQTESLGLDALFYCTEKNKTYADMSVAEKNGVSHRGKALNQAKFFLQKQYGSKHIMVPCAFILKEGKLLMSLRNDPHRPDYHEHWEFPGGGVEYGESMHENIIREVKEEVGLNIEVVKLLQHIQVERQAFPNGFSYQVYLVPYVCRIIDNGEPTLSDEETLGAQWFDLDEVLRYPLVGENARMFEILLPELREIARALMSV